MSTTQRKYERNIGKGISLWLNGTVLITGVCWTKVLWGRKCWHYKCKGKKGSYTVPCHQYRRFISDEQLDEIKAELV